MSNALSFKELASGRLNGLPGGSAAPLIVWSMSEMADVAVGRLMYRRKEPTQPIACLRVAVALDSERKAAGCERQTMCVRKFAGKTESGTRREDVNRMLQNRVQ